MPVIEGTTNVKTAVGEYDFAVDGGAVGTITLRAGNALGNSIPNGSVIISGYIEVDTVVTSGGAATLGVNANAAADGALLAATVVSGAPWSTTGIKAIIPVGSGANTVKASAGRALSVTVAVAALTAGKFRVVVVYR